MSSSQPSKKYGRRWRNALIIIVLIVAAGYIFRAKVIRAVTAYAASQQHLFAVPPQVAAESWWPRFCDEARFYWDIAGLRTHREERLRQFNPQLRPLVNEIAKRQQAGQGMKYSMHIYREIRWLLNFTSDTAATRARINDLRRSLTQPAEQEAANAQRPADGSWAAGINVWYLRLYYSVDQVKDSSQARYPLKFLDRINSPTKLKAKLDSDLYDNFTKTGTFNREELDETFSALARILFADKPVSYPFYPHLADSLKGYVDHWQNPATGCWGQWLVDRKGRVWKMDDMAMSFHVISDLHGNVAHKDRIAKRMLQLDHVDFPTGIRFAGSYTNHLNWDVVKIMKYAWPVLDTATRKQAANEISKMLNWCLTQSYQPDGSFKINELDDTLGDAFYYAVSFLDDAGYFDSKNRFWTSQQFPAAKAVHARILARIQAIGLKDSGINDAWQILNGKQ